MVTHNLLLGSWHYIQTTYYNRGNISGMLCDVETIDIVNPQIFTFTEDGFIFSDSFAFRDQRKRYFFGGDEERPSLHIESSLFDRDCDNYKIVRGSDDIIHLYTIPKNKTQERHTLRLVKDRK